MSSPIGMMKFPIFLGKIKVMFQTTNQKKIQSINCPKTHHFPRLRECPERPKAQGTCPMWPPLPPWPPCPVLGQPRANVERCWTAKNVLDCPRSADVHPWNLGKRFQKYIIHLPETRPQMGIMGIIHLSNHHLWWGRNEVVVIYPASYLNFAKKKAGKPDFNNKWSGWPARVEFTNWIVDLYPHRWD